MSWREEAKRLAAFSAIDFVKDGDIVGLGSGSTASYAVRELGRRVTEEKLNILGIPTSNKIESLAEISGIPLTDIDSNPTPDIAIDGADQVDQDLQLIKGMGAALVREKVVDSAAKKVIIVVDETKLTNMLGLDQVVPIEILQFSLGFVKNKLTTMGTIPILRRDSRNLPLITDNGNYILDVDFGMISDPHSLEHKINMIPGVIDCGLFLDIADVVCIGRRNDHSVLKRK
jgi:ribose 5-phosphate isomerase A